MQTKHRRDRFESGNESLDRYLKQQASQDARRWVAFPYVMVDGADNVIGYYTLTATSIDVGEIPKSLGKRLPRQAILGGTLLGRLAVDRSYQRQGLGGVLLAHAIHQSLRQNPAASIAVIVDAIDDRAVAFYRSYGFLILPQSERRLFLPRESLRKHL